MYASDVPTSSTRVTARRFDRGGELLRASFRRGSDGALLCEGIPVREGVLVYRTADGGERRELVSRQAVLDTARTIARAPVTLEHPAEGFVTAVNFDKLGVGDVDGEAVVEEDAQGGFAKVKLAVRRKDALDAIDSGETRELSPGYSVTLDETPGVHEIFGRYDAIQVSRECNHLALVPKGRGDRVVLRADAGDAVQVGVAAPVNSPAGAARSPREDSSTMKNGLIALLTALGVSRFDSEDDAIAEGLRLVRSRADAAAQRAPRLDAAAKKLNAAISDLATAQAKRGDAADYAAVKTSADAVMRACDEFLAVCEGMGEDGKPMLDAAMAAKQSAGQVAAAIDAAMHAQGQAAAAQSELAAMKADAKAKADAAELARLQGVAGKLGVKHDGLDLGALRVALAKTRIDSVDEKTPATYLDGILATLEADAKRGDARAADPRWDFGAADPQRKDGDDAGRRDGEQRVDDFYSPMRAMSDAAFTSTPQSRSA